MNAAIGLKQGETILIDGNPYIVGMNLAGGGCRLSASDDATKTLDLTEATKLALTVERRLFLPMKSGAVPQHVHDNCDRAIESFSMQQQVAMHRAAAYVRAAEALFKLDLSPKCLNPVIAATAREINDDSPPGWNSVRRWFNQYIAAGHDVRALIPGHNARGNGRAKQHQWLHDIAAEVIEEFWLRKPGPSIADAQRLFDSRVAKHVEKHGLVPDKIGDTFFYRQVLKVDEYTRLYARENATAAMLAVAPVMKGPQGNRPLDQIEVDATPLDVQVIHDHLDVLMGRPWLVTFIDRRTRCILGFYISFNPPSWLSTMKALVHAIMPKDQEMAGMKGIFHCWPCQGVGEELYTDRGKEFMSHSMNEAMFRLNMRQIALPARHPWLKGKIERWFRSLEQEVVHWIQGTTFSSAKQRGDYKSEELALLRLSELRWLITKWICDEYHTRKHKGTGRKPLDHWNLEATVFGPRPVPDARLLIPLAGLVIKRQLRRVGIEFQGLFYNSIDVAKIRNRSKKDMDLDAHIKMDPDDLSKVWVLDPVENNWIEIPCTDMEYASGLTLAQHKLLKRKAAENAGDGNKVTSTHLHHAKAQMIEFVAKAMAERNKSGASRRLKRLMDELSKPGDHVAASKFDPGMSQSRLSDQVPAIITLAEDRKPAQPDVDQYDPTSYSTEDLDRMSVGIEPADDDVTIEVTVDDDPVATPPVHAAEKPARARRSKLPDFDEL